MNYPSIGEILESAFKFSMYVLLPLAILGLWKVAEIIVWIFSYVEVTIR